DERAARSDNAEMLGGAVVVGTGVLDRRGDVDDTVAGVLERRVRHRDCGEHGAGCALVRTRRGSGPNRQCSLVESVDEHGTERVAQGVVEGDSHQGTPIRSMVYVPTATSSAAVRQRELVDSSTLSPAGNAPVRHGT